MSFDCVFYSLTRYSKVSLHSSTNLKTHNIAEAFLFYKTSYGKIFRMDPTSNIIAMTEITPNHLRRSIVVTQGNMKPKFMNREERLRDVSWPTPAMKTYYAIVSSGFASFYFRALEQHDQERILSCVCQELIYQGMGRIYKRHERSPNHLVKVTYDEFSRIVLTRLHNRRYDPDPEHYSHVFSPFSPGDIVTAETRTGQLLRGTYRFDSIIDNDYVYIKFDFRIHVTIWEKNLVRLADDSQSTGRTAREETGERPAVNQVVMRGTESALAGNEDDGVTRRENIGGETGDPRSEHERETGTALAGNEDDQVMRRDNNGGETGVPRSEDERDGSADEARRELGVPRSEHSSNATVENDIIEISEDEDDDGGSRRNDSDTDNFQIEEESVREQELALSQIRREQELQEQLRREVESVAGVESVRQQEAAFSQIRREREEEERIRREVQTDAGEQEAILSQIRREQETEERIRDEVETREGEQSEILRQIRRDLEERETGGRQTRQRSRQRDRERNVRRRVGQNESNNDGNGVARAGVHAVVDGVPGGLGYENLLNQLGDGSENRRRLDAYWLARRELISYDHDPSNCCICGFDINRGDLVYKLDCACPPETNYHRSCMENYVRLRRSPLCPLCRFDFLELP